MTWPVREHTLPDGRLVSATYKGEPVGWVVHLAGREDQPEAARDIHTALARLLQPKRPWPAWFIAAVSNLAARDTPLGHRYACPCCGYLTLEEGPTGTYLICSVCFWEDDPVQFHDPDYEGGANDLSLNQSRRNYLAFGATERRFFPYVRAPLPGERP